MMGFLQFFRGRQDLALIFLMILTVMVMIIPLPTILLDLLIALNITFTLLILVVAIYVKRPEEFSAFPSIILLATSFRLAITISTTRLILSQADAGAIIETFGSFVTRGSVLVGLVIFLVITTVQFIVITKGAERVAEVAARFTLDGLPGRQMSIDAELRNGDIDAASAQFKRAQLEKENQFFGAMDGAMKFVKGDAIAGLIIVAINIIGGLSVGMLVQNMPVDAALNVYSRLTVGDGLVGQIPALIVALCAGTIITRVNSGKDSDLGTDIVAQLASGPKAMFVAAAIVGMMAAIPGFPVFIFLAISALLVLTGYLMHRKAKAGNPDEEGRMAVAGRASAKAMPKTNAQAAAAIQPEPGSVVSILVGSAVHAAIDPVQFVEMRESELDLLHAETGLRLPGFGIEEDDLLPAASIRIMLDGVAGFDGEIPTGKVVAICEADILTINAIEGDRVDPKWGLREAYWVSPKSAPLLAAADVKVIEVSELIARTGGRFIRRNGGRIVGYRQIQTVIRELGAEHENLAAQISQTISAVQLLNLVRKLLQEGVPLMPRRILFEALLEASVTAVSSEHLIRSARTALARQICAVNCDENNVIAGYVLEPGLEIALRDSLVRGGDENSLQPGAEVAGVLSSEANLMLKNHDADAPAPVILTSDELRWPLSSWLRTHRVDARVMAFSEISSEFSFVPVGALGASVAAPRHDEDLAA